MGSKAENKTVEIAARMLVADFRRVSVVFARKVREAGALGSDVPRDDPTRAAFLEAGEVLVEAVTRGLQARVDEDGLCPCPWCAGHEAAGHTGEPCPNCGVPGAVAGIAGEHRVGCLLGVEVRP